MRLRNLVFAATLCATALTPAYSQRREPTPEQRIDRLERGLRQVQDRVYGRNRPADTAGFVDDPAVTQSGLAMITSRLDSIEQQMNAIVRTSEENSNRVSTLEAELARMRAELQRRSAAEERPAAPVDEASITDPARPDDEPPTPSRPRVESRGNDSTPKSARPGDADFAAAGEEAYDRGYQLWTQKRYDQAITALRAMASSFPGHRRVSWANNLVGRAMLDKGEYRAAAEALLANYRSDPQGERAADSLYYLGQASFKLRQPEQACKAYAELENVYGQSLRSELRRLLPAAKTEAKCR
ncbi:hypothetical protein G7076_09740 [Sphingomonas sp. HDW15A]|uniref:tetratricopeptide repeat protein n=1 Tax=Sphingomonas sp. HDW15A TaxID=2714942 RepID=UPI001409340E|nr:tetratricopeptide repeat protein [Sphingomonas sp. HDW15A]QIK96678.1 hypothetical protein G7076_09740 [Sphingomonas sp. HDW15A]